MNDLSQVFGRCESCGARADVMRPDCSKWCRSCDESATRLGYDDESPPNPEFAVEWAVTCHRAYMNAGRRKVEAVRRLNDEQQKEMTRRIKELRAEGVNV